MKTTNRVALIVLASFLSGLGFCRAQDGVEVRFGEGTMAQAEATVEKYAGLPKGVVLEGGAAGMGPLKSLGYDKKQDTFVINEKVSYKNPVSRKEWMQVYKSLKKDDNLGVTLLAGTPRVYGSLDTNSSMVNALVETDKILGGIIYGLDFLLADVKLPQNYKPRKVETRSVAVLAFACFSNYSFEIKKNTCHRTGCKLDVQLIPFDETKKSPRGGHMPDEKQMKTYKMEDGDRANINHMVAHQSEYLKIPALGKTAAIGEAAAFGRYVRDSGIDVEALFKQMK